MKTPQFFKNLVLIAGIFCFQKLSAAIISSNPGAGNWNATTTWVGGVVPTSADDVIIAAGSSVSVRNPYSVSSPAQCNSLTVDGTLIMGDGAGNGAKYLSVTTFIQIDNGGVLENDAFEIHYIMVGGDFINNGTFTPLSGAGSIEVSFNGSGSQLIDGGSSQTFYSLVVNKPSGQLSVSSNITSMSAQTFTLTLGDFVSGSSFNVSGLFILTAGSFTSGNDLKLSDRFINNGATFTGGTGTTTFNGTSQNIEGTSSSTFNNITIATSASTLIRTATILNGNLLVQDGAALATQQAITVNGTTTIGGGSSGSFAINSTAGAKTFVGLVTISSGGTWDNSIVGGNVHFKGGLNNQGTFKDGTVGVNYFETNSQTITGTISMKNVDVNPGGINITNNGTITVTNDIAGSATWVQGANSVLTLQGTYNFPMDATASNNTVEFAGGTQNTIATGYANLILSGSGVKTMRNATTTITGTLSLKGSASATTVTALTIGGDLSLSGASSFSAVNPLSLQGSLSIGDDCTFTTSNGLSIQGTTTVGNSTSGTLNISSVIGNKLFVGKVTVLPGGIWNNSVNEDVRFQGGISNSGTFNAGSSSNYFDVNSQSLQGTLSIPYIDVTTGVTLTNNGTVDVASDLTGAGTFVQGTNSVLNLGGATTVTLFDAKSFSNTVNFVGGAQTIFDTDYINLGLSGSGAKTFQTKTSSISGNFVLAGSAQAITASGIIVGGNLSIDTNSSLTNGVSLTVNGTLSGAGTLIQSSGSALTINGAPSLASIIGSAANNTVTYNVAAPVVIPGSYFDLNLNQASGIATLNGDVIVSGTLMLNAGNFDIKNSNFTLDINASASIAVPSATSMIVVSGTGQFRKNINATGMVTFPIGDVTGTPEYSPLTVNVTAASGFSSAYVAASVANSKSVANKSTTNFLQRYWSVTQSGISGCVADITATYTIADINGTEAGIAAAQLNGTFDQKTNGWKKYGAIGSNTLAATNAVLTDGSTSVFTGITLANPTVSITGGDGPAVCVGTQVQLGTTVTGEPTFVYAWSPTAGLTSATSASPKAKPGSTTVYTVTAYDVNGVPATANTTITTMQPTVSVNSLAFCIGGSGDLTATGANTYEWSPATGLSATTGSVVTANPAVTTTYKIIGTDANSCTDTVTTKVTVYPVPTKPTITVANLLTSTPKLTSSNATTYQWFKDGVAISGATSKTLTVSADGSYTVQVTSSFGCLSDISDPTVITILAVENQAGTLRIYPNPTTDFVKIDIDEFGSTALAVEVQLYDMLGRIQISKSVNSSDNSVDVRSLARGTYIIMARQDGKMVVEKLIKN